MIITTWDVVYGWRYLYFDVLSMAERQQCLDGGGMEYIIAMMLTMAMDVVLQ